MAYDERELARLIINRLTKEQLQKLIGTGKISDDELYVIKEGQESYTAIPTVDHLDKAILEHNLNNQAHPNLWYVHEQGISSDTWEINHNLNREPSVTVVDTANNVVMGYVTFIDKNNVRVKFNGSFKGKAYLN